MGCKIDIEVNNVKERYEIGYVAKQASGSVLMRRGKAVMIAAVARDDEIVDEDFLPLSVQYVEKAYAAGKIPGGFVKREAKPGDFETLTARIIDRSLRPLFPKGYAYPTQITVMVVSSDEEVDMQVMALNAASCALYLSDIPVNVPVCGIRIGKLDGEFVINPTNSQLKESTLDLYVAGTKDQLLMIEMRAIDSMEPDIFPYPEVDPLMDPAIAENVVMIHKVNEVPNEEILKALELAQERISEAAKAYENSFKELKKPDAELELKDEKINESLYIYIDEFYKDRVYEAINQMAKSERAIELKKIAKEILEDDIAKEQEWDLELIQNVLDVYKKKIVREMILKERKRADGRGLKDVRPISIETNLLPSVHGSCLFTRGQTQALVSVTLGNTQDAQMYDLLTEKSVSYETFMVHYNFPGFCVGEATPLKPPSRRELGHGNLAKRALEPIIVKRDNQTIRVVSEILESNGSSSMATVCGGALALKAAGVEIEKLVAGVAMGLVVEEEDYAILTDILGLEDHDGDMDFKVAGTREGITALQMDIKLGGIDKEILKEALDQAKEAREKILDIMEEAAKKIVINEDLLPSSHTFNVNPSKIADIIGQAGKTIKEIIEKFEVSIDINREKGEVTVTGDNKAKVMAACDHIKEISERKSPERNIVKFKEGEVYEGKVVRITDFGAFVELPGGVDGLLHISKLSRGRVDKVTDVVNVGDVIKVKILSQKGHKIELALVSK
ncbi:MAG: polyribonucleotide nucleotidyltransferase [Epsilonproteobacteria bacterium]|nr:polyribonucleotide nucleotidyltransferase [Campylobacterota bacterium]